MEFSRLTFNPTMAALGVGLLGLIGLVAWWLMRKRQKRVWLPTIRIMQLETHVLPRLVLRPPALLGFLCFFACSLVVLGFSMRPHTLVFTPFELNQTRVHIMADMSPSLAAQMPLDDYVEKVGMLFSSLKDNGRITVSTSHSPEVLEPTSVDELRSKLLALGFHRAGFKLGPGIKALLETMEDVDRLFVVSDRDQHTWSGFNWQYLQGEMDVRFVDLQAGGTGTNVYVSDVRFMAVPASQTVEWDVDLVRRGSLDAYGGRLQASYKGETLGVFPFLFSDGKPRLTMRLSWPLAAQKAADKSTAGLSKGAPAEGALLFKIEAVGDVLALDDEFRTEPLGSKQDVNLISEPGGERFLEDPSTQLATALQVLGFNVRRYDFVEQPGPSPQEEALWVIVGGGGGGNKSFCPESLVRARLSPVETEASESLPKVWLAPVSVDANYKDLCRCYARLVMVKKLDETAPAYCETIETRVHWTALLQSLGAKQVGGELGDAGQTFAWLGRDARARLDVLAFTVPLKPQMATGVSYAQFPVLVKALLGWQHIMQAGSSGFSWPRIDDTALFWGAKPSQKTGDLALLLTQAELSNVPSGESMLAEADLASLPPRWLPQSAGAEKQLPTRQDREDPVPWLKLAVIAAVFFCALEGGFMLLSALMRFARKRPEAALLGLALCGASFWAERAEAKVAFSLVGYQPNSSFTLATLAREVSHRTSIELMPRPALHPQLRLEALGEPWLWARELAALTDEQGSLRSDVALWLKRGGFLIIEAQASDQQLAQLSAKLWSTRSQSATLREGWLPLPPDHELMRSFYLLDALPTCNGQIWRGLHFDGRLAVLAVPYGFLESLRDRAERPACENPPDQERSVRIFVNLIMVALATDYKKDQIHLPEILKRLR